MSDRNTFDPEPQPSDGPDYHAEHAAWRARNPQSVADVRESLETWARMLTEVTEAAGSFTGRIVMKNDEGSFRLVLSESEPLPDKQTAIDAAMQLLAERIAKGLQLEGVDANRKGERGSDEDLLVLFSQPGTTRREALRAVYNAGLSRAAEIVQAKMDITGDRDEAPEALRDIRTAIEKEREVNV